MSYPVTSQPQCASGCYQTQLSDWHTGLTDCCNDMPICESPPLPLQARGGGGVVLVGREGRSLPTLSSPLYPRLPTLGAEFALSNPQAILGCPTLSWPHTFQFPLRFSTSPTPPSYPISQSRPPPAPNILRPLTPSGTFASLSPILSSLWDIRPRSADPRFAPPRGGAGGGHPAGRALTVLRPPQVCAALSPLCASPAASPTTSASAAARPTCPEACTPCAPACASAITFRCARSPGPAGGEGWDWPPGSKAERLTFLPLSRALSGTTGRPSPSACPAPSVRWRGN